YRLERSKQLLQQGYSSTDTANMLNYSSPSYFARMFKENFGKTPSSYVHFLKK
ncbi:MAG TPA: helix-turn-helix domain-containing protein, partial [Leucothrix mucor]|nr:helix-turn-helix domain-containing protein [Leucothrix mucor]